jgi:dTDP-4-dehydrorhamnose reductase
MIHVIVGGSGYLGSSLIRTLEGKNIIATYCSKPSPISNEKWIKLDVGSNSSIDNFFKQLEPSVQYIFYFLAAIHHPDKVESNWESAWNINVTGLAYFLSKIPENSDLVYSSTDNVYGESLDFNVFDEQSILNPVNEYGKQKAIAEKLVIERGYKVARYCFLIGPSKIGKPHFFDIIVDACETGKGIELMNDSYRSVISFNQAANITVKILERFWKKPIGIFNVSSDEVLSKYDLGLRITKPANHNCITPISIEDQKFFEAKRPKNVLLNNSKMKRLLNLKDITLCFTD